MPAGVGVWDNEMSREKEGWSNRSHRSAGGGGREEGEATASSQLQSWG